MALFLVAHSLYMLWMIGRLHLMKFCYRYYYILTSPKPLIVYCMLDKLEAYGVDGQLLKWFISFLIGRRHAVCSRKMVLPGHRLQAALTRAPYLVHYYSHCMHVC